MWPRGCADDSDQLVRVQLMKLWQEEGVLTSPTCWGKGKDHGFQSQTDSTKLSGAYFLVCKMERTAVPSSKAAVWIKRNV